MMYQIIGLLILAIFYGCYIIKMIVQKTKGIKTDHMGKDTRGEARLIEISLKIITYVMVIGCLFSIYADTHLNSDVIRLIGVATGFFGDLIFIVSVVTMRDSWRAGISKNEKTELVTDGIYAFSRNPAFLGFDLIHVGMLLMFTNGDLLVLTIGSILLFHFQITKVEEPFLKETFGKQFEDYCAITNRYLGIKIDK